jgi:hypothetical protein
VRAIATEATANEQAHTVVMTVFMRRNVGEFQTSRGALRRAMSRVKGRWTTRVLVIVTASQP